MAQPIITGCQLVVEGIEYYWGDLHEQGDQFIFYCIQKTPLTRGYDSNTVKEVAMGPHTDRFERGGVWIFPREQVTLNKAAMEHVTPSQPVAAEATAELAKACTSGIDWATQWIRNNYQDHTNIASLCEAMRIAAYAAPVEVQGAKPLYDDALGHACAQGRAMGGSGNALAGRPAPAAEDWVTRKAAQLAVNHASLGVPRALAQATEMLDRNTRPAAPLSEVTRQRLKRGSTGVCSRSTCTCERDGLGDECVWLNPAALRPTPSNERG